MKKNISIVRQEMIPGGWDIEAHKLWLHDKKNDAIQLLLKSINAIPGQEPPKLLTQFAYYLFLLNDFKTTMPVLNRILQINPQDVDAKLNLAVCNSRLGSFAKALEIYEALSLEVPNKFEVWTGLAYCQSKLGHKIEASVAGTKCLNIKDSLAELVDARWALPKEKPSQFASAKKKVIAFSLFGSEPRYLRGGLHNILMAKDIYPDWVCRFYVDGTVPKEFLEAAKSLGAELIVRPDHQSLADRLGWRFAVANDLGVGYFMVRDADSVINTREKIAVAEWLASEHYFHVMRDWWSHTELILAGMWGGVAGILPSIEALKKNYRSSIMETPNADQIFLRDVIWPYVRQSVCVHDRYFDVAGAKKLSETSSSDSFHIGQNEFTARPKEQATFLMGRLGKLKCLKFDVTR